MAARAAAGRQFLLSRAPSQLCPLPASLDLHTWTFQGFLRSSWVELIVVVMVRVMEGWGGTHSRGLASGGFHPIPTDLTSNTIWARCTSCVGASWTIQRWIPEKVKVILAYLQLQLQGKVKVEFSFWGNTWLLIFSKQLIWYDIPASPLFSTSIALSPQWCSDCQEWGPPWTMTWVAKKDLRSIVKMIKKRGESEIEGKSGGDELMSISIALAWWQYSF